MDELRARSGGIQISGSIPPAQQSIDPNAPTDSVKRLQQAKGMLEAKLISDSEYEAIKAKIINSV